MQSRDWTISELGMTFQSRARFVDIRSTCSLWDEVTIMIKMDPPELIYRKIWTRGTYKDLLRNIRTPIDPSKLSSVHVR